jgi:hypothetical protein
MLPAGSSTVSEQYDAIAPFYDELAGEEPVDTTTPPAQQELCTKAHQCKSETNCKWPNCKFYLVPKDNSIDSRLADAPWPLPNPPILPVPPFSDAKSEVAS